MAAEVIVFVVYLFPKSACREAFLPSIFKGHMVNAPPPFPLKCPQATHPPDFTDAPKPWMPEPRTSQGMDPLQKLLRKSFQAKVPKRKTQSVSSQADFPSEKPPKQEWSSYGAQAKVPKRQPPSQRPQATKNQQGLRM